ncbi:MAG: hypothetical protein AAF909_01400 [Pseudomonadota bacterium]
MIDPSDASTRSLFLLTKRRSAARATSKGALAGHHRPACALVVAALTLSFAPLSAASAEPADPEAGPEPIVLDCSDRGEIVSHLAQRYGETFTGLAQEGELGIVELYAADSGSWTILLTLPDGQSCPLAAGSNPPDDLGGGMI